MEGFMSKIIVANWKMNGSFDFIDSFFSNFTAPSKNQLIVCPPFPYLPLIKKKNVTVGAQNCSQHLSGAFTGEVAPTMLKDIGCDYVILGHSERRQYHHESNELIRAKSNIALDAGIIPIICVGESKEVRESGLHVETVLNQTKESTPTQLGNFMIAYEPVWAIGTGLTASEDDIAEMHTALRQLLPTIPLLYGGSVNKENSQSIMSIINVNGVLVGGASLKPDDLMAIASS
jgi:triosephosphate isomerase